MEPAAAEASFMFMPKSSRANFPVGSISSAWSPSVSTSASTVVLSVSSVRVACSMLAVTFCSTQNLVLEGLYVSVLLMTYGIQNGCILRLRVENIYSRSCRCSHAVLLKVGLRSHQALISSIRALRQQRNEEAWTLNTL